jgi:hypothetical protein
VDLEPRLRVSEDTLSELDLAHISKCVLGRQQGLSLSQVAALWTIFVEEEWRKEVEASLLWTLQSDQESRRGCI